MNNHTLKKIAELLGYEVNPSIEDGVTVDTYGHWIDFDPKDDPEQLLECEDYLLDKDWMINKDGGQYVLSPDYGDATNEIYAETLADAVLNAMEEMV